MDKATENISPQIFHWFLLIVSFLLNIIKKNFFNVFIYFWDRKGQSMGRGGAEMEGDTESKAGSRLQAVCTEPDAGLELTNQNVMTRAEVGYLTNWATQAPLLNILIRTQTCS